MSSQIPSCVWFWTVVCQKSTLESRYRDSKLISHRKGRGLGIEPATLLSWGDRLLYRIMIISCFITGLPVSQPNYPGPGDPDRTLPAYNCTATRRGRVPVLPQRLGPARLPLQSSSSSNRDPYRECLFQPESMHRKHSEVWKKNLSCVLSIFALYDMLCYSKEIKL